VNGYWRALTWERVFKENGIEQGPSFAGDYSMRSGYEAAQEILKTGEPFTALLVGTDYMALGAMRALREQGLRVPDDVSVVGYDNSELSAYIEPPLTTVEFKFSKQDEMAVKYLLELINDPEMELHQRVLMPDLIVRQSTRRLE
jgi:LacI family transcriptional regulator